MLRPYPTEIPSEAWTILANAFRGQVPDRAQAIHVGYEGLGFGLRSGFPDHSDGLAAMNSDGAAAICDHLAAGSLQGLIPWGVLIPLIADLIKKLIAG